MSRINPVGVAGRPGANGRPDVRVSMLGGPLDTGNLGVSALGLSMLAAVDRRLDVGVTLFDNGLGARASNVTFPWGSMRLTQRGVRLSRRLHRSESLWRMLPSSMISATANPNVRAMARSHAVWDISGGDSFSDIYGNRRFAQVAIPKLIALRRAQDLVLLPQTYGPFGSTANRRVAKRIVRGAGQSWARDGDSFDRLRDLLGADFDPNRHLQGVDVAFTLPATAPEPGMLGEIETWLTADDPVVGINVSGLLSQPGAAAQFGLVGDHAAAMERLVARFLDQGVRVVLVPHVLGASEESDTTACTRLASTLSHRSGLRVLPDGLDAMTTKWVIARLDWMTGARMHATIAALSSGTPVSGIAYSAKMRGVFASCGIADQVADARSLGTGDLVDALWSGFERRDATRATLERHVPATVAIAEATFDHIVDRLRPEGK